MSLAEKSCHIVNLLQSRQKLERASVAVRLQDRARTRTMYQVTRCAFVALLALEALSVSQLQSRLRGLSALYLDDLVRHFRFVNSQTLVDFFESLLAKEINFIRKNSESPKSRKKWWADQARQSLRYAFFLRYYASFESHLKGMCEQRAKREALPLRLSDINGNGFPRQLDKYLTRVAKCRPLHEHPLWEDVLAYTWVRNSIIHNDGIVLDERSLEQPVKRLLARKSAGLSLAKGKIRLSRRFCYRATRVMARFFYYAIEDHEISKPAIP